MDANQNPPSERDWTIEEQEEFFASQDAVTGLFSGCVANNACLPVGWMNIGKPTGIHVTSIVPPEQGWPVAMYCPICKVTTFVLSSWAKKPYDGDYFKIKDVCTLGDHAMRLAMKTLEYKPLDPYAYRPLPGGYVDNTGVHRGVPPTQQDAMQVYMLHRHIFSPYDLEFTQEIPIEEAKRRWPNTPIPGEEK